MTPRLRRPEWVPQEATATTTTRRPTWVPTNAASRAVLFCAVLILVGVLLGRVDLVIIAAPFAARTFVAWSVR